MAADGLNPQDSLGDNPRERRLGELINEYFDRCESGENLSQDEFLARYPDYAIELREHLAGLDLIVGLGSSSGRATMTGGSPKPQGSSAVEALADAGPVFPNIPGYDIHKQIGRGGMGIVYKGVQLSTKRLVALKLLLEGPFASEAARKRFEREISLAAQLRHPNIIPIYDSGSVDGRMFFAMEHIYGMALMDYIRANELDIKSRLRLFVKICGAVGHAHLRGVVHRDLKPTNILVDGAGEPHMLDFGLAKAGTFGDPNAPGAASITAQIIGTPAYMSPEQASGDPGGIDIRTDIYSLGVILYESLTGEMPYETNVAMGKILHNIAHAEPNPPAKLNSKVDGELSAIVLKTLDKNKDLRYQSVDSLASDIQRYLAGEPITAKPPSGLYLLRKVLYRHRIAVGIAALLIVIAAGGLIVIRQFSNSLAVKQQQLQQKAQETRDLQAQLEAKKTAADEDRRQRELARQQYEMAVRNLPPETRKALELLPTITSGEGALTAAGELAQRLFGDAESAPTPKNADFDPSVLLQNRAGTNPNKKESKPSRAEEARRTFEAALETAKKRYEEYQAEAAREGPTSQPASSSRPSG